MVLGGGWLGLFVCWLMWELLEWETRLGHVHKHYPPCFQDGHARGK